MKVGGDSVPVTKVLVKKGARLAGCRGRWIAPAWEGRRAGGARAKQAASRQAAAPRHLRRSPPVNPPCACPPAPPCLTARAAKGKPWAGFDAPKDQNSWDVAVLALVRAAPPCLGLGLGAVSTEAAVLL